MARLRMRRVVTEWRRARARTLQMMKRLPGKPKRKTRLRMRAPTVVPVLVFTRLSLVRLVDWFRRGDGSMAVSWRREKEEGDEETSHMPVLTESRSDRIHCIKAEAGETVAQLLSNQNAALTAVWPRPGWRGRVKVVRTVCSGTAGYTPTLLEPGPGTTVSTPPCRNRKPVPVNSKHQDRSSPPNCDSSDVRGTSPYATAADRLRAWPSTSQCQTQGPRAEIQPAMSFHQPLQLSVSAHQPADVLLKPQPHLSGLSGGGRLLERDQPLGVRRSAPRGVDHRREDLVAQLQLPPSLPDLRPDFLLTGHQASLEGVKRAVRDSPGMFYGFMASWESWTLRLGALRSTCVSALCRATGTASWPSCSSSTHRRQMHFPSVRQYTPLGSPCLSHIFSSTSSSSGAPQAAGGGRGGEGGGGEGRQVLLFSSFSTTC
ncbi:hypothetical protein EYF80_050953 [Liparis tanakae]|uniref:Uncharacterized protein n=1 Tax=Liparis tanakae TaxID=230148 RepID=A0A4Z2FCH2_9TELE|nr:hypothetical protein EYF80_050953 [Liparis tanakae]